MSPLAVCQALILRGTDEASTATMVAVVAIVVLTPLVVGLLCRAADRRRRR